MIYYCINTTNMETGWALSKSIWDLVRPRDTNASTIYYSMPQPHPETGVIYLPMDENDYKTIQSDAEIQPLIDILSTISSNIDSDSLKFTFNSFLGKRIKMIHLMPVGLDTLNSWPIVDDNDNTESSSQ